MVPWCVCVWSACLLRECTAVSHILPLGIHAHSSSSKSIGLVNWSEIRVLLRGINGLCSRVRETESNNRSVMPLDVPGSTRATMQDSEGALLSSLWEAAAYVLRRDGVGKPLNFLLQLDDTLDCECQLRTRFSFTGVACGCASGTGQYSVVLAWDWGLQLSPTNEECLVGMGHSTHPD